MAQIDIRLTGFQNQQGTGKGSKEQNVSVTDLLCEGPVRGLVGGSSGVFFNGSPIENANLRTYDPGEFATITFDGSSSAGDVTGVTIPDDIETPDEETPPVIVIQDELSGSAKISAKNSIAWIGERTFISLSATAGTTFTSDWSTNESDQKNATIEAAGQILTGQFTQISSTTGTFNVRARRIPGWNVGDIVKIKINDQRAISNISASSVTVTGTPPPAGTYNFYLGGGPSQYNPWATTGVFSALAQPQLQFRSGSPFQAPLETIGGVGGVVTAPGSLPANPQLKIINSGVVPGVSPINLSGLPNDALNDYATQATVLSSTNFGLGNSAKRAEADEVNFSINYNGFETINKKNGKSETCYAHYLIRIRFKVESGDSFGPWLNAFPQYGNRVVHNAKTAANIQFDHYLGLNQYRPFNDFEVQIVRLTRQSGLPVRSSGGNGGQTKKEDWQIRATAQVSAIGHTIKDLFSYPYTSVVSAAFSSKAFQSVPKRSYLMEGKLVQVPTTYTPREYTSDGVAVYEDFWDGSFKTELQYTDNPAWVFYDIMTNKRYGAGNWVQEENIDKYSLYRIAKYCDELVDDGSGGLEPRYRANVFLAKPADVYKVAKDMATMFLGILYWLDGKVVPVHDSPEDPIYSFTKGNVIDGSFSYESTGSRTRVNQVVVTWNDPDSNYEPVPLVVEDRDAIGRAGRIISQTAVAYGCTSESQALRYGRWKLWTAQNQKELISFKTGLQGHYVKPGDVISVQDADRDGIVYSGRISSASAAGVTLDRQITLNSGSEYILSTLVTEPAALLASASSVVINSVTYNAGDRVPSAYVYDTVNNDGTYDLTTLDSESAASNAFADSAGTKPISVQWKPYTYIVQTALNETSSTSSHLVPVSNFASTEIPERETIWALNETSGDFNVVGSAKNYKVLAIKQEGQNILAVSAVEHHNAKYDAVEKDYALGTVPDSIIPDKQPTTLPAAAAPKNLRVFIKTDEKVAGDEFAIVWDIDEDEQDKIASYEVAHNVQGIESPVLLTDRFLNFTGVDDGEYVFRVRSVGLNESYTQWSTFSYTSEDPYSTQIPRIHQLPTGVISNVDGRYSASAGTWAFDSLSGTVITGIGDVDSRTDVTSPPSIALSASSISAGNAADYYIVFDKSQSGLTLQYWDADSLPGYPYWRDVGSGDLEASQSTAWTSIGSVTVSANSNIMQGTGFNSSLELRDVINLTGSNEPDTISDSVSYAAKVISIESDTRAILDTTFRDAITSTSAFRTAYRPNYGEDALVARVSYSESQSSIITQNYVTVGFPVDGQVIVIGDNGEITLAVNSICATYITNGAISQSALDGDLAGRISSISSISAALTSLSAASTAADSTLSSAIASLSATSTAADSTLSSLVSSASSSLQGGLDDLSATVAAIEGANTASALAALSAQLAATENALSSEILATASTLALADASLSAARVSLSTFLASDIASISSEVVTVAASASSANASVSSLTIAAATTSAAFAQQITSLSASTSSNAANVTTLENAFATSSTAIATRLQSLSASTSSNAANVTTLEDAFATTSSALAQQITSLSASTSSTAASVSTLTLAFATTSTALAQQVSSLSASTSANSASIGDLDTAFATSSTAIASRLQSLSASNSTNAASITDLDLAFATTSTALAQQVASLSATTSSNTSSINSLDSAFSTTSSALASQITSLSASTSSNAASINSLDSAFATTSSALASQITSLSASTSSNAVNVTTLESAFATSSTAIATRLQSLSASTGSNAASISTVTVAVATSSTAIASQISSLSTTVGNQSASISTQQIAIDGVEAQYTVKIDNNDHISGFGLSSTTASSGEITSAFIIRADRFAVIDPTNTSVGYTGSSDLLADASASAFVPFIIEDGIVKAREIRADAITSKELEISASAGASGARLFFSASAIEVYDATRLRIRIGKLT